MRNGAWPSWRPARRLDAGLDQQVPADIVQPQPSRQSPVPHDRQARVSVGQHRLVDLGEIGARRDRGNVRLHHFGHGHIGPDFVDCLQHGRPRDHTQQLTAVHDGETVLARLIDHFQPPRHGVGGREHGELVRHHIVDIQLPQQGAGAHHFLFAFGPDEDEHADERPQPIIRVRQSDQHEQDGQSLPHRGGHDRRPAVGHCQGKHGPEQPSAIHRKRGDEIEHEQHDVGFDNPLKQFAHAARHREIKKVRRQAGERQQHQRDGRVDHRAGQGDGDLVPGIFRDAAQRGHAADGQQRNALDLHAEKLGDHAVAEFVQHDAGEDRTEQRQRPDGPCGPRFRKSRIANKGQQQQKRDVQPQRDSKHAPDSDRPSHQLTRNTRASGLQGGCSKRLAPPALRL